MTNFEQYKEELTADKFIDLMTMNCRFCPYKGKCHVITRKDCIKILSAWCSREAVVDDIGGVEE